MTAVKLETGPDQGQPWHYGDPLAEQRNLVRGSGLVDWSSRAVIQLEGPDRLTYLDLMSTAKLTDQGPGQGRGLALRPQTAPAGPLTPRSGWTYLLDPNGHILFDAHLVETGTTLWLWTEPGQGEALAAWLEQRRFRLKVSVTYRPEVAVVWAPGPVPAVPTLANQALASRSAADTLGGRDFFVPRSNLSELLASVTPAGLWAYTALRIAAGVPRIGCDTDNRTLPNELGVPSEAVSLDKGCYPGQETVARVHHLGRPPRRLVRLHLDGSGEVFPTPGTPLTLPGDGTPVGFLGSMAYHYELGPIGLGLVRRDLPPGRPLDVAGVAALPETIVDPDQGRHFRAPLPNGPRRTMRLSGR